MSDPETPDHHDRGEDRVPVGEEGGVGPGEDASPEGKTSAPGARRGADEEIVLDEDDEDAERLAELVREAADGEVPRPEGDAPVRAAPTRGVGPAPAPEELSEEAERLSTIAEVLRDQERKRQARQWAAPRRSSLRVRVATFALAVVAGWLWLFPPPWLEPSIPSPVTPERAEAGLRVAMFIQAQQVEAFRDVRGRLPDVLQETGTALPGIRYRRLDARDYRITGVVEGRALTYRSSDSLSTFVEEAGDLFPGIVR